MKIKNIFYVTFLSVGLSISCNGNTPSVTELEITYTGEAKYGKVLDESPYEYEFTLPFKLSRELKDGEHMDEVVVTSEPYLSDGAYAYDYKFDLDGTSLNLVTTICLNSFGIAYKKGVADYSYDINVLNSDGKISKQLNLDMSYEIDIKTVIVDCDNLSEQLKNLNYTLLSYKDDGLTRDHKNLWFRYISNGAEKKEKYYYYLLYKNDETTPFRKSTNKIKLDGSIEGSVTQTLIDITDEEWSKLAHEDRVRIELSEN